MGGRNDLSALRGLPHTVDEDIQGVRVQAVVDLLDDGEWWWCRVVEGGEQGKHAYGAEGGVRQLDRLGKPLFSESRDDGQRVSASARELNSLQSW